MLLNHSSKSKIRREKVWCHQNSNFYLSKLKDPKIKKLYEVFSNSLVPLDLSNKKIMIGVSGGADSLSVLFFQFTL